RFSGAIFSEHRMYFAGQNLEIDSVVGDDRRVNLGDCLELESRRRIDGGDFGQHARLCRNDIRAARSMPAEDRYRAARVDRSTVGIRASIRCRGHAASRNSIICAATAIAMTAGDFDWSVRMTL